MKKFACVIDGGDDPIFNCVFDEDYDGQIDECSIACKLRAQGKSRADCQYWQVIEVQDIEHTCPKCGYVWVE